MGPADWRYPRSCIMRAVRQDCLAWELDACWGGFVILVSGEDPMGALAGGAMLPQPRKCEAPESPMAVRGETSWYVC